MKEILSIHVGQAGVQLGSAVWELLCIEHGITEIGTPNNNYKVENNNSSFFSKTKNDKYIPRALFVDLEPTVIDEIKVGNYRDFFHPDRLISGPEDAANNFARGFFTVGKLLLPLISSEFRKLFESCDFVQAIVVYRSLGGGTGAGLISAIFEDLVDYPKTLKIELPIYPSDRLTSSTVEPYNCLLGEHFCMEDIGLGLMIDNEALFDISYKNLYNPTPSFTSINRLISHVISNLTASIRFESICTSDIAILQNNLVPYPRIHFPICTFAPLLSYKTSLYEPLCVKDMTRMLFERDHQLINIDQTVGKYMSCVLFYRGNINLYDVNHSLYEIKTNKNVNFVDWCPTGFKVGINPTPPSFVPEGFLSPSERNVLMITNNSSIGQAWQKLTHKFYLLFSKRSFIHWFAGEGMEECEFTESLYNINSLVKDYEEIVTPTDVSQMTSSKTKTTKTDKSQPAANNDNQASLYVSMMNGVAVSAPDRNSLAVKRSLLKSEYDKNPQNHQRDVESNIQVKEWNLQTVTEEVKNEEVKEDGQFLSGLLSSSENSIPVTTIKQENMSRKNNLMKINDSSPSSQVTSNLDIVKEGKKESTSGQKSPNSQQNLDLQKLQNEILSIKSEINKSASSPISLISEQNLIMQKIQDEIQSLKSGEKESIASPNFLNYEQNLSLQKLQDDIQSLKSGKKESGASPISVHSNRDQDFQKLQDEIQSLKSGKKDSIASPISEHSKKNLSLQKLQDEIQSLKSKKKESGASPISVHSNRDQDFQKLQDEIQSLKSGKKESITSPISEHSKKNLSLQKLQDDIQSLKSGKKESGASPISVHSNRDQDFQKLQDEIQSLKSGKKDSIASPISEHSKKNLSLQKLQDDIQSLKSGKKESGASPISVHSNRDQDFQKLQDEIQSLKSGKKDSIASPISEHSEKNLSLQKLQDEIQSLKSGQKESGEILNFLNNEQNLSLQKIQDEIQSQKSGQKKSGASPISVHSDRDQDFQNLQDEIQSLKSGKKESGASLNFLSNEQNLSLQKLQDEIQSLKSGKKESGASLNFLNNEQNLDLQKIQDEIQSLKSGKNKLLKSPISSDTAFFTALIKCQSQRSSRKELLSSQKSSLRSINLEKFKREVNNEKSENKKLSPSIMISNDKQGNLNVQEELKSHKTVRDEINLNHHTTNAKNSISKEKKVNGQPSKNVGGVTSSEHMIDLQAEQSLENPQIVDTNNSLVKKENIRNEYMNNNSNINPYYNNEYLNTTDSTTILVVSLIC